MIEVNFAEFLRQRPIILVVKPGTYKSADSSSGEGHGGDGLYTTPQLEFAPALG